MQQKELSVFMKDLNLKFLSANNRFVYQSGMEKSSELEGKTDYELIWTKEEAGLYRLVDQEVITNQRAKVGIIEPQTNSNGKINWIETSKYPLKNEMNEPIGVIGYYHDKNELYHKVAKHCYRITSKVHDNIKKPSLEGF